MDCLRAPSLIALATGVLTLFLVGCGTRAHSANSVEPVQRWTVAQVRTAFERHGLTLTAFPNPKELRSRIPKSTRGRTDLFGDDGDVPATISVYPAIHPTKKGAVLVIGAGKPHIVTARNVLASWTGRDSARIEAAMRELR